MSYEGYQRLRFDRPHPRVLRITMDNGRMNTADAVDALGTGPRLARRRCR